MSEDLISKEKAYKVLTEYYHHRTEMQHKALRDALSRVPPADIDLSDYSDRLWRNAYEQGKADAEPRWIPVTERLPEEECKHYWICTDRGYQCECRWTNVNHFWTNLTTDWHWNIFDVPQYSHVVAWMPLPEPYKRSEDAEID